MILDKSEKVKVAKSDIVCYKKVDRVSVNKLIFKPYYFDCEDIYNINELNTTHIETVRLNGYNAEGSFDGIERADYNIPNSMVLNKANLESLNLKLIGRGFHSAKTLERIQNRYSSYGCMVKCIIPKGSYYYESKSNLYVSNKIIIKEIL